MAKITGETGIISEFKDGLVYIYFPAANTTHVLNEDEAHELGGDLLHLLGVDWHA